MVDYLGTVRRRTCQPNYKTMMMKELYWSPKASDSTSPVVWNILSLGNIQRWGGSLYTSWRAVCLCLVPSMRFHRTAPTALQRVMLCSHDSTKAVRPSWLIQEQCSAPGSAQTIRRRLSQRLINKRSAQEQRLCDKRERKKKRKKRIPVPLMTLRENPAIQLSIGVSLLLHWERGWRAETCPRL